MTAINVLASQAKCINLCKNLRTGVVKCCANWDREVLCIHLL